jgi:SAM-dependent methyltransferase
VIMKKIVPLILNSIPRPWLIRAGRIIMQITSVFYMGNQVECPVCERRFRKFLPYGYNKTRAGVLCPGCFSLERHRLLWLYLKNRTAFFTDPLRVLHIAPEQCFHNRFREMQNLDYTTADLESPLADVKLDIQKMPLKDEHYDVVICNHVLEHVPDDRKAMREIYRVLKKGGYALLLVPVSFGMENTYEDTSVTEPKEREKHFRQKDHYRLYGNDYPKRITEAGFSITEENYILQIDSKLKERYRLPQMEFMFGYYKI